MGGFKASSSARRVARGAAVAAILLAIAAPAFAAAATTTEVGGHSAQATEIADLREDLQKNEKFIDRMLWPVTVLIGILALGGGLGVVFSIRDQRRVSQLHELTVAGEMSSQRRTEQSYGTFFEQSQTTLSLVNETLQLAKEATAQAAKSMDEKVKVKIDAIEEKAERLMLTLFNSHQFNVVVEHPGRRRELQEIAAELRLLEGYLSLQNTKLGHYTKFVKAIDQFLEGDTENALSALQLASQDPIVGDLQKFIEYWVGYMLTTVGQYTEAIERFEHDELDLPVVSSQRFQLERIIVETKFFQIAKSRASGSGEVSSSHSPRERFKAASLFLDRLVELTDEIKMNVNEEEQEHMLLEVARTQADIYEWIAYHPDPKRLDEPIDKTMVDRAEAILGDPDRYPPMTKAEQFPDSPLWKALGDDDLFRCWALLQAQEICTGWKKSSADLAFALAECHFKLQNEEAQAEFEKADDELHDEIAEDREQRRQASLRQSLLICHCRLLKLQQMKVGEKVGEGREEDQEGQVKETSAIRATQREVMDAVRKMKQGRVTVFSQVQRRNLTQKEFKVEVAQIVKQMKLGGGGEGSGDEEADGGSEDS
jgi:tetratricopeptide (TPR) repeat protein